jgi:lambda family phage portal protein
MAARTSKAHKSKSIAVRPVVQVALGGGLEGAERNSRTLFSWDPPLISPDVQISAVKDVADARSRDAVQNDGFVQGAVQTHRESIVGTNFRLNATPEFKLLGTDEKWAEEFQETVEARFNLLADSPECWLDASRKLTLTEMTRLVVGGFVLSGEVLGSAEWIREVGRPWRTAVQMLSPTRLCNPNGGSDTKYLRRGVERTEFGEPVAYHIRQGYPRDPYSGSGAYTWKRIPAVKPWGRTQILHIYEPLQVDQSRGISDMVAVLKQMRMTKRFQDIVLQNAVVNATYAAAVESELPKEVVFAAMGAGGSGLEAALKQYMGALSGYLKGSENIAIDGAKMPHLFPGTKLALHSAGTPGGVGTSFEESLLRHIAAALGLSYEQFSKDYSKTNYSSARASMSETWKYMQGRKKIVADRWATMIYMLVLEEDINAGNVPLPPGKTADIFYDPVMRAALCSCEWLGAGRGQIDELKETQSALMRIAGGLSTWEAECGLMGRDYRKVFRQLSREQKLQETYGLRLDLSGKNPTDPNADANADARSTTQKG